MPLKSFYIFLIALMAAGGTAAARQNGAKHAVIAPGLRFDQYFSSDGLPDNRVRNLFQDSKGYLWVGTMNGLCRFDGYGFRKYYKNDSRYSISGNWVHAIAEDQNSDLYIGTREGLSKYNRKTDSFIRLGKETGHARLAGLPVTALHVDGNKQLWIGTPGGLLCYDPASGSVKGFSAAPLKQAVARISPSAGNALWIGSREGIIHFDPAKATYRFFKIAIRPNPYGDRIWSMLEYRKSLYIGTGGDGLIKLTRDETSGAFKGFSRLTTFGKKQHTLSGNQVFDIVRSANGDLWLGTEQGLARIRNLRQPNEDINLYTSNALDKKSISNNIVYKTMIDRTGVLWCGTELGLNKCDLNLLPFEHYTFSGPGPADLVRSIASPDGRSIYLGTASTGLFRYDITSGGSELLQFGRANNAYNAYRSLYIKKYNDKYSHHNTLWAGTLGGVLQIDPGDISRTAAGSEGSATFATLIDSRGRTWTGTNRGVLLQTAAGQPFELSADKIVPAIIKTGFARQIFEDSSGNLWFGFENGGLVVLDAPSGRFISIGTSGQGQKLAGSTIISITEFPQKVIWAGSELGLNKISTSGGSLSKPGAYRIRHYQEEQGLPDKSINGILSSANGYLWISTIKGLARFDIKSGIFQNFLSNINFGIGSCYKVSERKLLFGTHNGFVMFDPYAVNSRGKAPQVALSDLKLFNRPVGIKEAFNGDTILTQSLAATRSITLNYHNNVFTMGFTALHFSNPGENRYLYKMEGFDKQWITADAGTRTATYTNLDAGTYIFKVRAADYAGNWSRHTASLQVTILPPPWKTWWAFVLYIVFFNVLLFVFVRYILIQSHQRRELSFQRAEKEQLQKLNEMKLSFFTNISHELRTPLTLISAPVEELLSSGTLQENDRSRISFIHRHCRKLLHLLDELMTFQKAEQGMLKLKLRNLNLSSFLQAVYVNFQPLTEKRGITLVLDDQLAGQTVAFDPDKLEMIMNNLLSNALKFTPEGGRIHIRAWLGGADSGTVNIEVEDNGKGIPAAEIPHVFGRFYSESNKKGTGVGLALSKNLVELHEGTIHAESFPGQYTRFTVVLPFVPGLQAEAFDFDPEPPAMAGTTQAALLGPAPAPGSSKLLIVDDNKEILDYLELLFSGSCQVSRAVNGKEALACIAHEEPDLIISDLMMPVMDGTELCIAVKSDMKTSHIPFILLTAKAANEDKLSGFQVGADDYIPKPFHPEILKVRAAKMIEARRRLMEKYKGDGVVIPKDIARNPLDEEFLQRVLNCIDKNISNDEFSVEELGEAVFMSRSHLFRKLKAITGQTPIELIYQVRIRRSMELLLERRLSISEIAYEVGFKNPSSFTSSFKKQYGKSPKEYLSDVLKEHNAI